MCISTQKWHSNQITNNFLYSVHVSQLHSTLHTREHIRSTSISFFFRKREDTVLVLNTNETYGTKSKTNWSSFRVFWGFFFFFTGKLQICATGLIVITAKQNTKVQYSTFCRRIQNWHKVTRSYLLSQQNNDQTDPCCLDQPGSFTSVRQNVSHTNYFLSWWSIGSIESDKSWCQCQCLPVFNKSNLRCTSGVCAQVKSMNNTTLVLTADMHNKMTLNNNWFSQIAERISSIGSKTGRDATRIGTDVRDHSLPKHHPFCWTRCRFTYFSDLWEVVRFHFKLGRNALLIDHYTITGHRCEEGVFGVQKTFFGYELVVFETWAQHNFFFALSRNCQKHQRKNHFNYALWWNLPFDEHFLTVLRLKLFINKDKRNVPPQSILRKNWMQKIRCVLTFNKKNRKYNGGLWT